MNETEIAEFLAGFGGESCYDNPPLNKGDGNTFYNYNLEYKNKKYLEFELIPAIHRQLKSEDINLDDREKFEDILTYTKNKIGR